MGLEHDAEVSAVYICASDRDIDRTDRLNWDRAVDFDADGRMVGCEFMNVRRHGVKIEDLMLGPWQS